MVSKARVKLIAFELGRQLGLESYFEALSLLEAYQLMRSYQVPLIRLSEFWGGDTRKLQTFIEAAETFLIQHGLELPVLHVPKKMSEKPLAWQLEDSYASLNAGFEKIRMQIQQGQRVALLVDDLPMQLERLSSFLQRFKLLDVSLLPFKIFVKKLLHLKVEANLEAISYVFTSPYIQDDLVTRHQISAKLYSNLHAYVDLQTYAARVPQFPAWQQFAEFTLPEQQSLQDWLLVLKQFLEILQIQVPPLFLEQLEAYFASVNFLSALTYAEFLQCFQVFVEDSFIAHSPQFHLLQMQDLASYSFDEYWYLKTEVGSNSVNPFLPLSLQKEYGMIFEVQTYFELKDFVVIRDAKSVPTKPYRADLHGEVLTQPERLRVQEQVGGAMLLNEQAACAFKAFAHFQLGARQMVVAETWLNAKFRGVATHRVLERIWQELKDLSALLKLDDSTLQDLVKTKTQAVLIELSHSAMFFLPKALLHLEAQRLSKLILLWLNLEKKRPYFKVLALEQKALAYLGPLIIQLRLDRVDELEDGQRVVIDYKTGQVNVKDWFSEPMEDVQLPLYLLINEASGAALAQVNLEPRFSGVLRDDLPIFSELKHSQALSAKTWEDMRLWWQEKINTLAQAVVSGVAHINPLSHACDYCDLQALCRVQERGVL